MPADLLLQNESGIQHEQQPGVSGFFRALHADYVAGAGAATGTADGAGTGTADGADTGTRAGADG